MLVRPFPATHGRNTVVSGAIGGAASAIAAPIIRDGLYGGSQTVVHNGNGTKTISYGNIGYNATTVALATLIGGGAGALLGHDVTSAALAAQNESLNNALSVKVVRRPVPTPFGVGMMPMPVMTDDPLGTPNNGPQNFGPVANPLEDQSSKGNTIATPNNRSQGSPLTGTPASGPQGPTILSNPGCMLAPALCAGLTAIAQIQNGVGVTNVTSDRKIAGQLDARGWTEQDVRTVIKEGPVGTTTDNRSAKTPDGLPRSDTASVYGSKNGYVVVNDRTGEFVQVSGKMIPAGFLIVEFSGSES